MSAAILLAAETKRALALTLRYPLELAFSLVLLVVLFYALLAGYAVMGVAPAAGIVPLAAGYMAWIVAAGPLVGIAADVQSEAQAGTLENVCMASCGLESVLLARAAVGCLHSLAIVVLVGSAIAAFADGQWKPSWSWVPFAVAAMLGATGLGLVLAGMALLWKRVGYLLVATQVLVLGVALATPVRAGAPGDALHDVLVPLSSAMRCLKHALAGPACDVTSELPVALAGAALWLAIGCAALRALHARAQAAGCLAER